MDSDYLGEIQVLHFEHRVWTNELNFYADEIKIFEHQLEDLVVRNIRKMLPGLEKFQNIFIRQKEVLDELQHDIKIHEQELALNVLAGDEKLPEGDNRQKHRDFQEKMDLFKKLFAEIKQGYMQFLRKWH